MAEGTSRLESTLQRALKRCKRSICAVAHASPPKCLQVPTHTLNFDLLDHQHALFFASSGPWAHPLTRPDPAGTMNNYDPSQTVQVNAQALLAALSMVQPQLQTSGVPQWQGQYWQQRPQQPQPQPGASSGTTQPQPSVPQWSSNIQGQTFAQPAPPANSNDAANAFILNWQQQQQQLQLQQAQFAAQQAQQQYAQPQLRKQRHQTPVGTVIDDETRLVDVLKKCQAQGLTPRQAIESLDGVNDHSASAWKDYFLDNLHRLYALSNPSPDSTREVSVASSNGASSSHGAGKGRARAPELPKTKPRLPQLPRRRPTSRPASPERPTSSQARSRPLKAASPKPAVKRKRSPENRPILPTGTQRRRYSPVPVFHAGVRIPNSSPMVKPTPPKEGGGGSKLTDEHKVYFIHYLRWRTNKSPTIARPAIYEELEKETNYSADVWRLHWDKYPETPDQVCIEAYNRAVPPTQTARTTSVAGPARASRKSQPSDSEDGSTSGDSDSGGEPSSSGEDSGPRGRSRKRRRMRVTEEDLRAMAKYKVANYNTWNRTSRMERWREFAERPENRKRSLEGWYTIGESSHTKQLEEYFQECAQEEHMLVRMSEGSASHSRSGLPSSASPSTTQERSPTLVDGKPSPVQEYIDATRKRGATTQNDKAHLSKRAREASSD
ncbi:hypothetical protein C8Q78DRAFT_1142026 [Trametes maxima]|nr:hypothetical protein C8Q78DRAFT_1142026 [Trametes maxima]